MNLVHFDPWSVIDQLHREINQAPSADRAVGCVTGTVGDWVPSVDIIEHKDRFSVRADVPGVDPAAIDVSMEDGVLSIAGERSRDDNSEIDGISRRERASGRFLRRFMLPDTADAGDVTARYSNGVLEISIGKLPEVRARRITVEAA